MRKWLISICLVFMVSFCFAVPGIEPVFPISSGEYVFYRDYTFSGETYIGFLQYDDSTLAIRYYAKNPESGLGDITVYISLNPKSDFIDMTGEKIVGNVTAEDTETLNYLHDLLYEFAGRRKKLNNRDFFSTLRISQDYVQFGGDVTMIYDYYIPIFNLNRIVDEYGSPLFEAVTFGTLLSSNDTAFVDFKGFQNLPNFSAKDKKEDLSKKWASMYGADDMKVLGEDAFSFIMNLDFGSSVDSLKETGIKASWFESLAKTSITSSGDLLVYAPSIALIKTGDNPVMKFLSYSKEEDMYAFNILIFKNQKDYTYQVENISIYGDFYYENKKYFDSLAY